MSSNDAVETLMASLGHSGSALLRPVLEALMTPEQAQMVATLPGTAAEVAEKTGGDAGKIQEVLDGLFFEGVVFPRGDFEKREFFRFARSVMQLHDATTATQKIDIVKDRDFFELWHTFFMEEFYPVMGKSQEEYPAPFWRIVPAYKAVENLELAPQEDYRELLKAAKKIAVVPCACRNRTEAVDEPCAYTEEQELWKCIQFGRAAEYVIKRGSGKELSLDEALDLCDHIEEDGLLHMWPNSTNMQASTSCNCCRDCCVFYVPADMVGGSIGKVWAKSRFEAVIDQEQCDGCQDCIERCMFDAIELIKPEGKAKAAKKTGKKSKKMKATVDSEKCWGCGVCFFACDEAKALTFKEVRPLEHIPTPA